MEEAVHSPAFSPGGCSQSEGCLCPLGVCATPQWHQNPEQNLLCIVGITGAPLVSETFGSAALENLEMFIIYGLHRHFPVVFVVPCSSFFYSVKFPNPGITDCQNVWVPFVRLKDKPLDAQCSLFRNMDRHCKPIKKKI